MDTITKKNFWLLAMKFGEKSNGKVWPVIEMDTPEFKAWHQYFANHLGFVPWVLEQCIEGKRSEMTMPMAWPQHFDTEFAEVEGWRSPAQRGRGSERWMRQNLAEMQAHFGLNWGITV